jgi:hypothetical protein
MRESIQNAGERIQSRSEELGRQIQDGAETACEELGRGYRHAETMMAMNPATSVLIGFGLGFGFGLVVTAMLGERERGTWAERNLPDRLRRMPDSLHDSLDQLADSVRRLPDAIRAHLPNTLGRH